MRLPSPAMVVALIALVVAASGTSYAVGRATSNTITACRNTKTGILAVKAKCGRSETPISWSASGRPGPTGAAGAIGATGPAGAPGATGATGSAGTATAYGTVWSMSLEVDPNLSRGFTSVIRPALGVYCLAVDISLRGTLFQTSGVSAGLPLRPAVASIEISHSSAASQEVFVRTDPSANCPAYTYEIETTQGGNLNNAVDFTIIVP